MGHEHPDRYPCHDGEPERRKQYLVEKGQDRPGKPDRRAGILRTRHGGGQVHRDMIQRGSVPTKDAYFESRMKVGTMPAAEEKPVFPMESQLEQPCTLPR